MSAHRGVPPRTRRPLEWDLFTEISDDMGLESVGLTLTVADVYRRVKFPQRAPALKVPNNSKSQSEING